MENKPRERDKPHFPPAAWFPHWEVNVQPAKGQGMCQMVGKWVWPAGIWVTPQNPWDLSAPPGIILVAPSTAGQTPPFKIINPKLVLVEARDRLKSLADCWSLGPIHRCENTKEGWCKYLQNKMLFLLLHLVHLENQCISHCFASQASPGNLCALQFLSHSQVDGKCISAHLCPALPGLLLSPELGLKGKPGSRLYLQEAREPEAKPNYLTSLKASLWIRLGHKFHLLTCHQARQAPWPSLCQHVLPTRITVVGKKWHLLESRLEVMKWST